MRRVKKIISRVYRRLTNELYLFLGQHDDLTPPPRMISDPDRLDGSRTIREFVDIGEAMVAWLIKQGLSPSHRLLDVGCGVGRMARPLTKYLKNDGSYDGIDISLDKIQYCQATFEPCYPNFRFHHADIYSKFYNPDGKQHASKFRFPFDDETFDAVILVSVFTHMLPQDMEQYLSEIARVMINKGKCTCTYWLIDKKRWNSCYEYSEVCQIYSEDYPEHGVGYLEEYVRGLYRQCGLIIQDVYHGDWHKRKQDIIVAVKRPV